MARTTKAKKKTRQTERTPDPVRNALVLISITVVTIAFGIGLYLQFGMAFWLAVVAALAVYLASWLGWFSTDGGYYRHWIEKNYATRGEA